MKIGQEILEVINRIDHRGPAPNDSPELFLQAYGAALSLEYTNSDEDDEYLHTPKFIASLIHAHAFALKDFMDIDMDAFAEGCREHLDMVVGSMKEDLAVRHQTLANLTKDWPTLEEPEA